MEAIPLRRNSLDSLNYEKKLTLCFIKEACAADESALSYHLSRTLGNTNAALIINGMSKTFEADSNGSRLKHNQGGKVHSVYVMG